MLRVSRSKSRGAKPSSVSGFSHMHDSGTGGVSSLESTLRVQESLRALD
jgi:hypothetical protein